MSLLFGPLGVQGGERRLNVAVSRARYNIKLVSSILPSDIDLRRTKSVGIRMLRAYIEFAINGSVALRAANPEGNDAFMDAVEKFIASRGYKTKKKVGCSEYKIDIAVIHPENDDCFAAGIECDGLLYASAKTARDRDHLRKSILEAMGWSIYRVWSAEWAANPAMEGRKLLDFIDNAISTGGVKADSTDSAKARARPDEFADSISEVRGLAYVNNRGNPSNPYGFKRYVEAKWRDTPDIRNYSGAARIAEEIKYIVGIEQPIHINLLYQRMAGAFGSKTVTDPIKNYVDTVNAKMLKRDIVKDNDGFLTLAGFNDLTVRIPQPGSMARRIDLVPCEEISLAIITIAAQAVGVYADDLLDAAAKALGYEGNSESVKKFMKKGLDRLVNGGRLKIVDGKVKAPER